MIASSFRHRDGGWSVSIHGGTTDASAFMALMRWLEERQAELREGGDDTRKYEAARLYVDSLPDVDAKLEALAQLLGGAPKVAVLGCAVAHYERAVAAIRRGDQLMTVKGGGGDLTPLPVDVPLTGETPTAGSVPP